MKIFETLFIIQSQLKLYHTINGRFDNSTEDDHRRYLDMAMKIDPNDPYILHRKEDKSVKFIGCIMHVICEHSPIKLCIAPVSNTN